jgi:ribosomal-protein-serine acetyltransferase
MRSFINSAHNDFESLSALDLAIEYKGMSELRDNYPYMFVGSIGLKNIDLINKKADLGYWIREEYWGRGIPTECVRFIINYAFSSSGLGKRGDSLCLSKKQCFNPSFRKEWYEEEGEVNEYHELSKRYRTSLQYIIMKRKRLDCVF